MSAEDRYSYTLQSCDALSYPDIVNLCTVAVASPYDGKVVYVNQAPFAGFTNIDPSRTYLVVANGLNSTLCNGYLPNLKSTSLNSCADALKDKLYRVENCADKSDIRNVRLAAAQTIGNVLRFTGECACYRILAVISDYDENPTILSTHDSCTTCLAEVTAEQCDYGERALSYAVSPIFPKAEPQDRGFKECCYSNCVLANLSNSDPYYNDFTTVYFKRQTPTDTVTYQIIGVSTGTTVLVNGTHGTLYAFGSEEQPDLSYFRVEWRDILSTLGEDVYTIRMVQNIAGQAFNVDSIVSYKLKQWTQNLADHTVRIDWTLDGYLEKKEVDFKNTGYANSVRVSGFFGNRTSNIEQDKVLYVNKNGFNYYQQQVSMLNYWNYAFAAYQIPECVVRPIYEEAIFGNDIYISDYNRNNHDYRYSLYPVILEDDNGLVYNSLTRLADVSLVFGDRAKNNRKTNC